MADLKLVQMEWSKFDRSDPDNPAVRTVLKNGDIEIGAVEIKNSTDDTRATVNSSNELKTNTRTDSLYQTNHLDDYTVPSVTYIGKEDASGVYQIKKIDETGTFPVVTYASITNNPTLTTYTTAWAGRVTATYNIYSTAF
jgi:hypothetical protein